MGFFRRKKMPSNLVHGACGILVILTISALATSTEGLPASSLSAWDEIDKADPGRLKQASHLEREWLELLTIQQLEMYLEGESPEEIVLFTGETLAGFINRKSGFDISWYTIDSGGGIESAGGTFKLSGSIGQADASATPMSGGQFTVAGGFWSGIAQPIANPCIAPGTIFCDGFESGDTSEWSTNAGKD